MKHLLPIGLAVAFFPTDQLRAQDLIGAEEVIAQISGQPEKKSPDVQGKASDPMPDSVQAVRADLNYYREARFSLTPNAAAEQWLALVQRLTRLGMPRSWEARVPGSVSPFQDLVAVLPPSAGWPHLQRLIEQERPKRASEEISLLTLQWFVYTLRGNAAAKREVYARLEEMLTDLDDMGPNLLAALNRLTEQMIADTDDPEFIKTLLALQLQRTLLEFEKQKASGNNKTIAPLTIPDLVPMIGEAEAEVYLKKLLTTYPGEISFRYHGDRTMALARRVAQENIEKLAAAQWSITESYDASDLYEAMIARFGQSGGGYKYLQAAGFQTARLILAGKVEEALSSLDRSPNSNGSSLPTLFLPYAQKVGKLDLVIQRLHETLQQNPKLSLWDDYFNATLLAKKPEESIALMKEVLARKSLSGEEAKYLRDALTKAVVAIGKLDEGMAALQKLAKDSLLTPPIESPAQQPTTLTIARIGYLMKRPEWEKEGIALAFQELEAFKKTNSPDGAPALRFANSLATTLIEGGQPTKAEQVLKDTLRWVEQKYPNTASSRAEHVNTSLAALVGIYSEAGRAPDVVTLLDRAPWWGATDLSQIMSQSVPRASLQPDYLADAAARALEDVGQKDAAMLITEAQLTEKPGDDRAYEQLLRSSGAGALPLLDRLAAQYRFEERPLIWKAQILLKEGKLTEAEESVRAAIAIDPSDGEQGPGDRMRAYAILADIREARGDAKEAEFFRNVIKAIRLSEEADQLYKIGLIGPAMTMYEDSLKMFADAYCIQSRLALRMNEQGRWKEAEEHYRKAYELMPDSFGRIESHCFGCEGAFAGEKPQGVADKVFTRLAEEKPDSPRVQYLLGYLRESQKRPEEALRAYQRAVALDPDYLNAWKKMASLRTKLLLTSDERNAIALNLARLDPYSRDSALPLQGVTDLAALWTILSEADKRYTPTPSELYPLNAAAKALSQSTARRQQVPDALRSPFTNRSRLKQPTTEFAKAPFVTTTASLLQYGAALRNP